MISFICKIPISLFRREFVDFQKTWGDNAYTGVDPETPDSGYPIPFSVTLGVNVTF